MSHNNHNLADIARGVAIASYRKCLDCLCRTLSLRNAVIVTRRKEMKCIKLNKIHHQSEVVSSTHFHFRLCFPSLVPCIIEVVQVFGAIVLQTAHMVLVQLVEHISCERCRRLLLRCLLLVDQLFVRGKSHIKCEKFNIFCVSKFGAIASGLSEEITTL